MNVYGIQDVVATHPGCCLERKVRRDKAKLEYQSAI